jgi:hypothetical protein
VVANLHLPQISRKTNPIDTSPQTSASSQRARRPNIKLINLGWGEKGKPRDQRPSASEWLAGYWGNIAGRIWARKRLGAPSGIYGGKAGRYICELIIPRTCSLGPWKGGKEVHSEFLEAVGRYLGIPGREAVKCMQQACRRREARFEKNQTRQQAISIRSNNEALEGGSGFIVVMTFATSLYCISTRGCKPR